MKLKIMSTVGNSRKVCWIVVLVRASETSMRTYPRLSNTATLTVSTVVESAQFDCTINFEGWNCGKITSCGKFGKICGGYGIKGAQSDITKTFYFPAGKYSVTLDFIKIDSWFA